MKAMQTTMLLYQVLLAVIIATAVQSAVLDDISKVNIEEKGKFSGANAIPDLFEGDIVKDDQLTRDIMELNQTAHGVSGFDAIRNRAWPGGQVAYSFASNFNARGRQSVMAAIAEYHAKTCIRFKPRTTERNYMYFFHGGGCYSMIGIQGGAQRVSLGYRCTVKGIAIHEIMHALGFYHEQSRIDRDSHVTVYRSNIMPGMEYNFAKYRPGQASTLNEPYDKQSVMHYGNYAFSRNGRMTIVSRSNPRETLGQKNGLSQIDVKQLNKYYKCGTTVTPTKKPTGTCNDGYKFCPDLKSKWCSHTWVKQNCKSSCNLCPTTTTCKDNHGNCPTWARSYCNHPIHKKYMTVNCKKSCRLC